MTIFKNIVTIYIIISLATTFETNLFAHNLPVSKSQSHAGTLKSRKKTKSPTSPKSAGTKVASNNSIAKPESKFAQAEKDTAGKIIKIWNKSERFYIQLTLADYTGDLTITANNIIGKEVKKIYQGGAKAKGETYSFSTEDIPNGVYICILQGRNFRNAEKFIVSKSR